MRAMCHLVWFESDEAQIAPLRALLRVRGAVQERPMDAALAAALQRSSTPEEWRAKGKQFFGQRQYTHARQCFAHSGDAALERWAAACELEEAAATLERQAPSGGAGSGRGGSSSQASEMFAEAARQFLLAGKAPQAAECFERARRWADAGRVHLQEVQPPAWAPAARCFELAAAWRDARGAHEHCAFAAAELGGAGGRAGGASATLLAAPRLHVERALACCLRGASAAGSGGGGASFDERQRLLEEGREMLAALLDAATVGDAASTAGRANAAAAGGGSGLLPAAALRELQQLYLYLGALHWHADGERGRMMAWLLQLGSPAKQRRFLGSRGYHDELVEVERAAGNFEAVAKVGASRWRCVQLFAGAGARCVAR